jgi:hypothetical protein
LDFFEKERFFGLPQHLTVGLDYGCNEERGLEGKLKRGERQGKKVYPKVANGSGIVVERLTHNLKIEGMNPATANLNYPTDISELTLLGKKAKVLNHRGKKSAVNNDHAYFNHIQPLRIC